MHKILLKLSLEVTCKIRVKSLFRVSDLRLQTLTPNCWAKRFQSIFMMFFCCFEELKYNFHSSSFVGVYWMSLCIVENKMKYEKKLKVCDRAQLTYANKLLIYLCLVKFVLCVFVRLILIFFIIIMNRVEWRVAAKWSKNIFKFQQI